MSAPAAGAVRWLGSGRFAGLKLKIEPAWPLSVISPTLLVLGQLAVLVHAGRYGLPSWPGGRCSVVRVACGEAPKSELICSPGNASGECSLVPLTGRKNTGPTAMPP